MHSINIQITLLVLIVETCVGWSNAGLPCASYPTTSKENAPLQRPARRYWFYRGYGCYEVYFRTTFGFTVGELQLS